MVDLELSFLLPSSKPTLAFSWDDIPHNHPCIVAKECWLTPTSHNSFLNNLFFQVNLLDGKRSLNINIFLKQFRSSNEDIIQMVLDGEYDDFGSEKLKGLVK